MRYSEEFRDRALVEQVSSRISSISRTTATIMEVCGTHTMSAARFGLRSLLPDTVKLVSGPGCPVCVTDQRDIDSFLALGAVPGVILTSFGDMLRVPGSRGSLETQRAGGTDVRVVYSPLDAVDIARDNPGREIAFFGVGFETTVPATALAVKTAVTNEAGNFSVYSVHKTMPAALRALIAGGEVGVSGFLMPGHVTTIIGAAAYDFVAEEFGVPCAVAGFEPLDMMLGIESLVRQIEEGTARVENAYSRAVRREPNERAAALLGEMMVPCDAQWRGLGAIPGSGLSIAAKYSAYDAEDRFRQLLADIPPAVDSPCRCGDVLRAALSPQGCPCFGTACIPTKPLGPCMVSSEGACAAAFIYGEP